MVVSALSAPIYAASLAAVMLGRKRGFVTTPKGAARTRDSLLTFRKHLLWALAFGVPLGVSFANGYGHLSMRAWSVASLAVCLAPLGIWRAELARKKREAAQTAPVAVPVPVVVAEPAPVPVPVPIPEPVPSPILRPMPPADPVVLATERRKRHRSVRFGRHATLVAAPEPVAFQPVRKFRPGRRSEHVVVHFERKPQAANDA
jgi:hypothetical protein